MSDGLSDLNWDRERAQRFNEVIRAILDFLKNNGANKDRNRVIELARELDSMRSWGFWTGPTNVSEGLPQLIDALLNGDSEAWKKFQGLARKSYYEREVEMLIKNFNIPPGAVFV